MWAILLRRILPLKSMFQNVNDAAHDPQIIHALNAVGKREIRSDVTELRWRQQNKSLMANPPAMSESKQRQIGGN